MSTWKFVRPPKSYVSQPKEVN